MSDRIRAFIAIKLPDGVARSLDKIKERLTPYGWKVRWVPTGNIHLTLRFLGDIDGVDVAPIGQAMANAVEGLDPVSLRSEGIGAFPGVKRPRALWVGVKGQTDVLAVLQGKLEKELAKLGFAQENRPFRGHLTIGRAKGRIDPKQFLDAMHALAEFESSAFVVDRIILFRSELKPSGAVYTELSEAAL